VRKPLSCSIPGVTVVGQVVEDPEHASPAEVIAAQRRLILSARSKFDVILLDTAPMLSTNDASEILSQADQVLLVARVARTTKEAADRAAEQLDRRAAPVVGIVLTAALDAPAGRYYYYYSGRSGGSYGHDIRTTTPAEGEDPTTDDEGALFA
jgi:Mrp family chromosome partitioning ATPase